MAFPAARAHPGLDISKGVLAIDFHLAGAQHVEVGTIEDQDPGTHGAFFPFADRPPFSGAVDVYSMGRGVRNAAISCALIRPPAGAEVSAIAVLVYRVLTELAFTRRPITALTRQPA